MITYYNELYHYGVGHDKGGHSGRYPWGSGKKNRQLVIENRRRLNRESQPEIDEQPIRQTHSQNESNDLSKQLNSTTNTISEIQKVVDRINRLVKGKKKDKQQASNSVDDLSTEELREVVKRLQLERQYKELSVDPAVSKGNSKVSEYIGLLHDVSSLATSVIVTARLLGIK